MTGSLTIKRTITVRAVVTPRWKEDAERELSNAISNLDQQLAQLEQEGQRVIEEIRRQSANPLDPRVGMPPIWAARYAIDMNNAGSEYNLNLIRNGGFNRPQLVTPARW